MYRPVVILFSCLLIFGCNQKEVDHPNAYVFHASGLTPGEVNVCFAEGTMPAEARQFMSSLGLSLKYDPAGPLLFATVSVPVDSEDQWVKKLLTYPIVRSAGRSVQAEPSYYNDPPLPFAVNSPHFASCSRCIVRMLYAHLARRNGTVLAAE